MYFLYPFFELLRFDTILFFFLMTFFLAIGVSVEKNRFG